MYERRNMSFQVYYIYKVKIKLLYYVIYLNELTVLIKNVKSYMLQSIFFFQIWKVKMTNWQESGGCVL
jgi:hypothetical protein